jgi:peptidyl-prolyl cis-trans isomerase A (cyclophilin A)
MIVLCASLAWGQRPPATPVAPPPPPPQVEVNAQRVEVDKQGAVPTDVLFEVGEATVRPQAGIILDAIAKALVKDQTSKLTVGVHTDDIAPDGDRSGDYLKKLSQKRADAVKAWLVKRGVAARRLTAVGYGNEKPAGGGGGDEGRRANRRLELVFEVEVRPPQASDLAVYMKQVKGGGPKLIATIATTLGTLHCELFPEKAPATVANFVGLATGQKSWTDPSTGKVVKGKPFYDGLVFHRVIPSFMIQGGDPQGTGTGGPGYMFADEISPDLRHKPGTLAMANAGPNTNGSQFFIDEVEAAWLDGKYTVFGLCKEVEVVTKIATVPRGAYDMPRDPIKITKVTIAKGT